MFNIGEKVKVLINDVGYRKCEIVGTGLNSFWVEYNGKRYLVATKVLEKWNRKRGYKMEWKKTYPTNYKYDGRIKYTCGDYSIMKGDSKNIWTGKPMSDQVWHIKKSGEKVGYGHTLKEAKANAEEMMKVRL